MSAQAPALRVAVVPARPDPIPVYRDDGPLALALGHALGPVVKLPAPLLIVLGLLGLVAAIVIGGPDTALGVAAAVIAWVVLTLGIASGTPPRARIRWAEPPLMRATEYTALIWIAGLEGPSAYPAAFALLAALTFRHYDLVYRLRHRAELPPRWLNRLAAGWDGRVIIAWLLLALGALPAAMYVWAALLGAVSVAETVASWRRFERSRATAGEFDELEGEGE